MVGVDMEDNVKKSYGDFRNKMKSRKKRFQKRIKEKGGSSDINLHADTYEYLMRIVTVVDGLRNDPYEMGVLVGNVLSEVKGTEVHFAKIGITARLLEDLLPYAGDEDFTQFVTRFVDNLRPVFTDRAASHILELISEELLKRYVKVCKEDDKLSIWFIDIFTKISLFALNNIETFIWETSSNHVIRAILNILNGRTRKGEVINEINKENLPSEFQSTLEKFAQAIINSPQIGEFFNETITSGLIQTLLFATKELEVCGKIIKKITNYYKSNVPNLKDPENGQVLRLLEATVEASNEKRFQKIYKTFFKDNLNELAISKSANFVVQKLIRNSKNKEQFDAIFNELLPVGEKILETGHTGVLLELAQGCVKHKSNQGEYIKMMMRILRCQKTMNEDSDLAQLTCSMVTSDKYNPDNVQVHLHGAVIIQAMLNFGKPIKIINGLLNMDTLSLLLVISDVKGCHIVDAFMQSQTVGEKSRDRLFKKLTGNFTKLATSKYGSRSLDAIWNAATTKNRIILMEELKENESELNSSQFGKIFSHKTYLSTFRRNKEDWIKRERTMETTKRCFSDIIPAKKGKFD